MATDVHKPINVVVGYRVEPATNGGWIVWEGRSDPGFMSGSVAFSTWPEMLLYLERAHNYLSTPPQAA